MSNSDVFNADQAGQLPDNSLLPLDDRSGWAAGDENCIAALRDLLTQADDLVGKTDDVEDAIEELAMVAEDTVALAVQMRTPAVEAVAREVTAQLQEKVARLYMSLVSNGEWV